MYTETLTTSAVPHLTSGVPDGTETINASNIQNLSRSLTNAAGQMIESDSYYNLSGVTYSQASAQLGSSSNNSAAGNYAATLYGHDTAGRQTRVQAPTGTIPRTVYDGQGRVTSIWVGTNDTPPAGPGLRRTTPSPSNMIDAGGRSTMIPSRLPPFLTTSSTAGGSLAATTYYVKISYVINGKESAISLESVQSVAADHVICSDRGFGSGTYSVYVSTAGTTIV